MFKKIVFIFILVVGGILGAAIMQPSTYTVVRSATLPGDALKYFNLVNDFAQWRSWSPWAQIDPAMKIEISTPSLGVDATYYWSGNSKAGEGKMKIVTSESPRHIQMNLDFVKPIASNCVTTFKFEPDGTSTKVTWTMSGTNNFISKIFSLFINMDKMIGADFEKGLANLSAHSGS